MLVADKALVHLTSMESGNLANTKDPEHSIPLILYNLNEEKNELLGSNSVLCPLSSVCFCLRISCSGHSIGMNTWYGGMDGVLYCTYCTEYV